MSTTTSNRPASSGPAPEEQTSVLANGGWILVAHGVALVALLVFIVASAMVKEHKEIEAYTSLATPIEAALNDKYVEDITYTRDHGRVHPSSRFYTYTETLMVDGLQRTDCSLSYREVSPAGAANPRVDDVALACAIKPVHETPRVR
jgi:hypothetical protein